MDVVVRVPRDVEVNHQFDGGDIKTTRGDVRRDKDARRGGAEAGEVRGTLRLREEGVEGGDAVGEAAEGSFEEVRGGGAVAEDDGWF